MKIRTFICIEIPDLIREELAQLQNTLKPLSEGISWPRPEGMHLTLKFLGDVDSEKIDEIAQAVKKAAAGIKPFSITVEGVGAFPNFRRPRVLWVGVQDEDQILAKLQQNIELELERIGFSREQRPFSPHLTLARIKFAKHIEDLLEKFQTRSFSPQNFQAHEIIVMRSELQTSGAIYTPLKTIQLNE